MSRQNPDIYDTMRKVDGYSVDIEKLSSELADKYCSSLELIMTNIKSLLETEIEDYGIERMILDLANCLYFVGSAQEDLGIKEDICKSIRQEVYTLARQEANGTVADKDSAADIATQNETLTLAIYSRAYKKVKFKVDAGYEMLNSLKKIMNRRIAELELSNSRFIGGQPR